METTHKAGFVALAGRANAGKSTLLNALLKFKLSIVSAKPQTTRHKILGILGGENFQACFLDTPGLIDKPSDPLQKALRQQAASAIFDDADLVVCVVDAAEADLAKIESSPLRVQAPLLLVMNKIDRVADKARLFKLEETYRAALSPKKIFRVSALKGEGIEELKAEIVARLPENPAFYEKGQISDRWERFFAAEIVREHVFELYHDEIPHATAVVVEAFRESPRRDEIYATLYVERDSQKGILIGKCGKDLRRLTERSQAAIENFLGRPVALEIWIKVRKDWRKDERSLREFGYRS